LETKLQGLPLNENNETQSNLKERKYGESKFIKKSIKKGGPKNRKRPKRGKYRKYNYSLKKEAVELSIKMGDPVQASKLMNVPLKNLRRWIENGPKRKKGGRKTHDPQMEVKLYNWVSNYRDVHKQLPSRKEIKSTALRFSHFPEKFKASKGWYEKFMLRHFSKKRRETYSEEWEELKRRIRQQSHVSQESHPTNAITTPTNAFCRHKKAMHEKVYSVWEQFVSGKNEESISNLGLHIKQVLQSIMDNKTHSVKKEEALQKKVPNQYSLSYLLDRQNENEVSIVSNESNSLISEEDIIQNPRVSKGKLRQESNLFSDPLLNQSLAKNEEFNQFPNESKLISSDKMSLVQNKGISVLEKNSSTIQNGQAFYKGIFENLNSEKALPNDVPSSGSQFGLRVTNLMEFNENHLEIETQKTKKMYSPKPKKKNQLVGNLQNQLNPFSGFDFQSANSVLPKT
jgi:transposase-like protein